MYKRFDTFKIIITIFYKMAISYIPLELLLQIFVHLKQSDIKECSLINRQLHTLLNDDYFLAKWLVENKICSNINDNSRHTYKLYNNLINNKKVFHTDTIYIGKTRHNKKVFDTRTIHTGNTRHNKKVFDRHTIYTGYTRHNINGLTSKGEYYYLSNDEDGILVLNGINTKIPDILDNIIRTNDVVRITGSSDYFYLFCPDQKLYIYNIYT